MPNKPTSRQIRLSTSNLLSNVVLANGVVNGVEIQANGILVINSAGYFVGPGGGGAGSQGATGAQGTDGYVGSDGAQGTQGVQGTTGTGTQGVQGTTGNNGSQGVQGLQGTTGSNGTQGTQGTQGVQGLTGTGTQGVQGLTGSGSQGVQGGTGLQGLTGSGIQGATGSSGLVTETIATSAVNATTLNGSPFQISDSGPSIHFWNTLPDELWSFETGNGNFNFRVYNPAWNESNTWLSVYRSGTSLVEIDFTAPTVYFTTDNFNVTGNVITTGSANASVVNASSFVFSNGVAVGAGSGPQGTTGIQGVQGTTGTGTQGVQGTTGIQGTTGPQGVQGTTGSQGVQGTTGTGTQGVQGVQGTQSIQGVQGRQGVQGLDGAFAAQGVQGTTGGTGAAGSTGEIQFNTGGNLTGNANLRFDTTESDLIIGVGSTSGHPSIIMNVSSSEPPAAAANTGILYFKSQAGRMMPSFMGPSGFDTTIQPHLGKNKIAAWNFIGSATTAPGVWGMAAPTFTGTATTRNVLATSFFQSIKRTGYLSAATAGSNAAARLGVTQFLRGNTAGMGGFHAIFRFGISDPAVVPGAMMFIGFHPTTGQIANATNVAAMTNVIGVAQIATSNTLQIITNRSGATAALVDTGLLCNVGNTNVWDVTMYAAPNSDRVGFRITDLANTANQYSTVVIDNLSTNLPLGNTVLSVQQWRTNNTAAAAVGIDFISTTIETDN